VKKGKPQLTRNSVLESEISHTARTIPRKLLLGGLIPLSAGAVGLGVLAGVRGGLPGLVAAVAGAVLAAAALAVGPGLMAWSARSAPQLALVMGLMGYAVTIILLGAVLLVLRTSSWLDHGYLAAGLVLATLLWLAGQAWTVTRLRIPAFGVAAPGAGPEPDGSR
jgi:ATP synthase protein I